MLELAGIFSDGMILQRGKTCTIFGHEDQSREVTVELFGRTYRTEVKDSAFAVEIPAQEEARDVMITITGSEKIVLHDVCFGDVFFLTGQSNMELPVSRTLDVSQEEVDASDYPYIRQYRVTPQFRLAEDKIAELPRLPWTRAVPEEIGQMSAAGFYCAKRLYDKMKIPVGLVLGAQGGSTIESWMPREVLRGFGDFDEVIADFLPDGAVQEYLRRREEHIASWRAALESGDDAEFPAGTPEQIPEDAESFAVPSILYGKTLLSGSDTSTEMPEEISCGGDSGTEDEKEKAVRPYRGVVWFYKEFELQNDPVPDAFLYVGDLIDADVTYINGVQVGRTEYRYPPRKYPFDGTILRKGRNVITVRLIIEGGAGGFVSSHPYYLRSGDEVVLLEGEWKRKWGREAACPQTAFLMGQTIPTSLYRSTVVPLRDYSFRGIWWYQGESNTEQPARYHEKFASMIDAWRSVLKDDIPVLAVEMPDYQDPISGEMPEGWTSIQEQQREAEQEVPGCAVVYARDLFTPLELHPQRKSELGARMAEKAEELFYH
ncbi:MAG: hypothetical protein J5636_11235 [Clostridiales bacterium]|nr:hypothetical protein [Clostridiales bacterium]